MEYIDEEWCDICQEYTQQKIYDSGHERDSSCDSRRCLECGGYWSGLTDKWEKQN